MYTHIYVCIHICICVYISVTLRAFLSKPACFSQEAQDANCTVTINLLLSCSAVTKHPGDRHPGRLQAAHSSRAGARTSPPGAASSRGGRRPRGCTLCSGQSTGWGLTLCLYTAGEGASELRRSETRLLLTGGHQQGEPGRLLWGKPSPHTAPQPRSAAGGA